jgi:DNA replication protein DnaC
VIASLATGQWIRSHDNVLIVGPTGAGKTYLASALAQMACRLGCSALYLRLPRFFRELAIAKGDGRYGRVLRSLAKTDLVVLDDWGLAPLTDEHRRDLLELLDDRHGHRATIVASQLPIDHWHAAIGEPTLADAILDRLVHNAYKITLERRIDAQTISQIRRKSATQRQITEALRRGAPRGGRIRSESAAGFSGIRTRRGSLRIQAALAARLPSLVGLRRG